MSDEYLDPTWWVFGLGFENNPLGAENCMSPKFENLKLLDSFFFNNLLSEMSLHISNIRTDQKFYFTWDMPSWLCDAQDCTWHPPGTSVLGVRHFQARQKSITFTDLWSIIQNSIHFIEYLIGKEQKLSLLICNVILNSFITEITSCNSFWLDTMFLECKHSWEKKAFRNHICVSLLQSPNLSRGADSHKYS